jgi:hypothetical protein
LNFSTKYIFILLTVLLSIPATAQDQKQRGFLDNYYNENLHFGFLLGINNANFNIQSVTHFETFDSLKRVQSKPKKGFNLGIISELRLQKYITLRFTPNLSFSERTLEYYFEGFDTVTRIKNIESTCLNFPINLKLRSKRVKNFGAYVLGGGAYNLDLASKRKTINDGVSINDQIVKLQRDDFSYEIGAGAEFYFQYFKFAIEGKLSTGIRNLLIKDNTIFSNSIDKLNSRVFLISITFEG